MDKIGEILSRLYSPGTPEGLEKKIIEAVHRQAIVQKPQKRENTLIAGGITCIAAALITIFLFNSPLPDVVNVSADSARAGLDKFIKSTSAAITDNNVIRLKKMDNFGGKKNGK